MIRTEQGPREIVLVGGGHSHVFVLRSFGERPVANVRLTLVAKEAVATYSGMLPGTLAGLYGEHECEIDLRRLCAFAGATFFDAEAAAIRQAERRLVLADGRSLPYDLLSLDVGIVPDVGGIRGAAENALLVKPISCFREKWGAIGAANRQADEPRHAVVVGGGPGGFELAHALRHRYAVGLMERPGGSGPPHAVTLVTGPAFLSGLPARARRLARRSLAEADIRRIEAVPAVAVAPDHVELADGRKLPADVVLVATAAAAPRWLRDTGLSLDAKGCVAVRPTLQAANAPEIFAAGDCAAMIGQERPKAGVFAVRQGPVLADNLRRLAEGRRLRRYRPQKRFLVILSLGGRDAIAARNGLAVRSTWAWRLKDRIDRSFVARFTNDLPQIARGAPAGPAVSRCDLHDSGDRRRLPDDAPAAR